ncbi:sodium:solute symporter family protein [Coraliomargarita sp. SDUM461004]|uniref:Sodium:solute symporter family protein n=1 Tax=Thalassobacterium sedimentorum TaxID=3041258 RepID=A0ABU1ADZ5_9BACT|nr:sodium:solute symporter family protein [Coraliomargarita sp. SDUM461004]MDQ8192954.1 sodium:solute symporter family protein [Coraliomargarita sp. SDUM461004]
MTSLDYLILVGFFACLIFIAFITNRMTRSVAGFLSSERLAGRYLLTIAQSMAFIAAIGIIGNFEAIYRNGFGGIWWGMIFVPVNSIIALSGFVVYRYRETRVLTMAQFLQLRYSRRLRVFSGFLGFVSGVLNCAVFPMVTANFLVYFLQLPESYSVLGLALPTYHSLMIFMVSFAVLMAVSGGQVTIMVTDFFQGVIVTIAFMGGAFYVLHLFGWSGIIETLLRAESLKNPTELEVLSNLVREEGVSMVNPFKMDGLRDFGIPFFLMTAFLLILRTGVWQGGAGYMAAASTPHEAKMGQILGGWRWLLVGLGTMACAIGAYVLLWHPEFIEARMHVEAAVNGIHDPYLQSQALVPLALYELFPSGLLGLFLVLMVGASISTDNSAYHSWGSIFLQDVVMPFRKRPFTQKEHLKYLRWSIVMIGVIAVVFSSVWTMKDFILMWFQITASIYIGGASCAIIGGLYWKKATTQGAWAGLITGSLLSVGGIAFRQFYPEVTFPGSEQVINGLHLSVFAIVVSYAVFILVSLLSWKQDYNLDKLLHRGEYAVQTDHLEANTSEQKKGWLQRIGITREFTTFDKVIYLTLIAWTLLYSGIFICITLYNLVNPLASTSWTSIWSWLLGLKFTVAFSAGIWFICGGLRDTIRLFRKLKTVKADESDDGTVRDEEVQS